MLSPFPGYLPAAPGPLTSGDAAALARRIRDDAGRYQPDAVLDRAVAGGLLEAPRGRTLFRYEIRDHRGPTVVGLVGLVRAADLVPHEGTLAGDTDEPAPEVEIRPILALVEGPLPDPPEAGRRVEAIEVDGTHHSLVAVDHGDLALEPPVVADGHHRRRAVVATRGAEAGVLTMVVGNGGAGLEAGTFHRVFADAQRLPTDAGESFDIEPIPHPTVVEGALVWLEGPSGRAFSLRPLPEAVSSVPQPLRGSPAAVAQALLYPLLGLHEGGATHVGSWDPALDAVPDSGGVLLLPEVEISAVIAAARLGRLLPPKASRFHPKPLRGLVLRMVNGR